MNQNCGWVEYWDGDVSLYVSPRHLEAHYEGLFAAIEPLLPKSPFTVLDFGCGEALMAPSLAARGGSVALYDEAASRRQTLRQRFSSIPEIRVIDDLEAMAGACDLVLVISVLQYVPLDQLPALLARLRRLLKPGGRLVIGDVLRPSCSMIADVAALLRFGWEKGFLWDAMVGLVKTLRSDYRRERSRLGLTCHEPAGLVAILAEAGFAAEPLGWNIGHAGHRHSVIARLAP